VKSCFSLQVWLTRESNCHRVDADTAVCTIISRAIDAAGQIT
jgi:hypothetical protein